MARPSTKGRMINRDISDSKKFALLSPSAAVLFCMLIPHYNAHGKMNGDPGYIKGEVCPRITYLTLKNIPDYLQEISEKTNVKWFKFDERYWIHSTNFLSEHQQLQAYKIGEDLLPTYSGVSPDLVVHEVEVKDKDKDKGKDGLTPDSSPRKRGSRRVSDFSENAKKIYEHYKAEVRSEPTSKARALYNIDNMLTAGHSPELLWECVNEYISDIKTKQTEPKFRMVCANFFGPEKQGYVGFIEKARITVEKEYAAKTV